VSNTTNKSFDRGKHINHHTLQRRCNSLFIWW